MVCHLFYAFLCFAASLFLLPWRMFSVLSKERSPRQVLYRHCLPCTGFRYLPGIFFFANVCVFVLITLLCWFIYPTPAIYIFVSPSAEVACSRVSGPLRREATPRWLLCLYPRDSRLLLRISCRLSFFLSFYLFLDRRYRWP